MHLLNLGAIPIAYERNVYSITKKELNIIKKTKYRKRFHGLHLAKNICVLENKTLATLKKFMIKMVNQLKKKGSYKEILKK